MEFNKVGKIAIISVLLVFSNHSIISQDRLLKKAYISLNESNWEAFNDKLNKYLTKDAEHPQKLIDHAAHHYLMALYFQKSTDYDPVKWYEELMVSYSALKLIPEEERKKNCAAFNFCMNNEKEEISKVVNAVYHKYERFNNIYYWKDFIAAYGKHSLDLKHKAEKNIEELAFKNAISKNSEAAYKKFIKDYPNASSERIDKAIDNCQELAFKRVISLNAIDDYNDFLFEYPNTTQKELVLKNIQKIEYQAVLKEAEYPNGTIDPIKNHLEKYPNTTNKRKLGELYFKLISSGSNYNHNAVNLYQYFLELFDVTENQMKTLADLVNENWDLPLMEFFIKEFPFYDQIKEIKENRKWCIETDSLIFITQRTNYISQKPTDEYDDEMSQIEFGLTRPRNVKQTENGITIHTRANIVSLINNIVTGERFISYSYRVFLPLFKAHKIDISLYEGFHTMLVADKNGKKTTFDAHESFGQMAIIFRNKKNIFFTTTTEIPYGGGYSYFSIYSYNNGVITKVYNDDDFLDNPEDGFFTKTNFSKTNRIQCTYEQGRYMIEYEYSEENNTWKKIEGIMSSEGAMKRYIEKLIDQKKPIKIAGRSLLPENCKGKNHYNDHYKYYYNGVCYSSVFITQRGEINSLPINYKGLIYPIKLTDDNILIGTSSTEEDYYMEDYDEDELIFIDFKNAYKRKEIISPPFATIKIGNLEVMTEDLGEMNWEDAQSACEALGDGWRLPTIDEWNILYENKDKIGGFALYYYWSSTEYDGREVEGDYGWVQEFDYEPDTYDPDFDYDNNNGYAQYYIRKHFTGYVRAVRTF
jgi:hypothetical protein